MKVGSLVRSIHEDSWQGLVLEIGPEETATDHGKRCARVQWFDGEQTIEFIKMLEIISAPR